MIGGVKFRTTKRLAVSGPKRDAMEKIGRLAFAMIQERITKKGLDAQGRPLPPLASRNQTSPHSVLALSPDDPRFKAFLDGLPAGLKSYYSNPDNRTRKPTVVRLRGMPYARLKERLGKVGKRDGQLTGRLWDNGQVTATTLRGQDIIRVTFRGSSKGQSVRVARKTAQGLPVYEITDTKIYNRDKARLMQFTRRMKDGKADESSFAFRLMELSAEEMRQLVEEVLRETRLLDDAPGHAASYGVS